MVTRTIIAVSVCHAELVSASPSDLINPAKRRGCRNKFGMTGKKLQWFTTDAMVKGNSILERTSVRRNRGRVVILQLVT